MSTTPRTPTISQLQRALELTERIQALESELKTLLGGVSGAAAINTITSARVTAPAKASKSAAKSKGQGRISPEALERIAAAQRLRWAKVRASKGAATAAPKSNGKRALSPEARERIAAAQRKRWAKARKSK